MSTPKIRGRSDPRRRYPAPPPGKSRTKQSMAAQCDINKIMAQFQKTGAVTHYQKHAGTYGFASGQTFHDSMNIVTRAQQMFEELPSKIRNKFKNDPSAFLDFVADPLNRPEMDEMGLTEAKVPPEPAPLSGPPTEAPPTPPPPTSEG